MELLFALAALALLGLVLANVLAVRVLRYEESLQRVTPVVRDVFHSQHLAMILLLLGSAAACLFCAPDLVQTSFGRAVAGFLALLFSVRLVLQFTHFDAQERARRPALHALFVLTFVYLSAVFAAAAAGAWTTAPPPPSPSAPALEWMSDYLATHSQDGHAHEPGTPPHAHTGDAGHSHEGEIPPHEVPIVAYAPLPAHGPHAGRLARLSTRENAEAGFLECKLANESGALDAWFFTDRTLRTTLELPATATVRLRFLERGPDATRALEPAPATLAVGSGNLFVLRPTSAAEGAWLATAALPALLRVEIVTGEQVYVSDDFELYPRGHDAGR